jgi:Eukaryotic glutathione synthase, ATP binding domain
VGAKKFQQVLANEGVLDRCVFLLATRLWLKVLAALLCNVFECSFVSSDVAALLRQSFSGLYPLDQTEAGRKAYDMVMANPTHFVMKPQREGGGL